MDVLCAISLLVLGTLTTTSLAADDFSVTVDPRGQYTLTVANTTWLYSAPTTFQAAGRHHSTADGTLRLVESPRFYDGVDVLGSYRGVMYTWGMGAGAVTVKTGIKTYNERGVAVFTQYFPDGLNKTSVGDKDGVISAFPAFLTGRSNATLGVMSYGGLFIGWIGMTYGRWSPSLSLTSGLSSGPLVLFDRHDRVLVVSPLTQLMSASLAQDRRKRALSWGVMGEVGEVPAGYQYSTVVCYGSRGVNRAMSDWGSLLQKWYRRTPAARDIDPSIAYLSYYTDNGAYYYHYTEPGLNYEKTMAAVVNGAKKQKIPYRSVQLDDWWYPIKGPGYGATVTWTADPKVFPHGLQFIYNMTQMPVVAHNRYWSNTTPYAKQNGGRYNFIMDGKLALPDDEQFWYDLFQTAKEWGLIVYEQDWLNYQVNNIRALHSDLSLGGRWLRQMGEAATRLGMQIQYCMAQPRHLMASLEVPAVSQVRASIDYQLRDDQWQIAVTSMFADALGVAPFKDNFWTRAKQPHNVYNKTEPHPLLQATVALLSTGPVGVGDRAGNTDTTIINRLINADGLLLKPSKPATAIDAQILQRSGAFGDIGPVGELWSTHSLVSGFYHGIIFSPQLNQSYTMGPKELGFPTTTYLLYSSQYRPDTDAPVVFDESHRLTLHKCELHDYCLYHASPVIMWRDQRLCILGELSKLVPVSPQRVAQIQTSDDDVLITLSGPPGETVHFYVYYAGTNVRFTCVIRGDGVATISVAAEKCY